MFIERARFGVDLFKEYTQQDIGKFLTQRMMLEFAGMNVLNANYVVRSLTGPRMKECLACELIFTTIVLQRCPSVTESSYSTCFAWFPSRWSLLHWLTKPRHFDVAVSYARNAIFGRQRFPDRAVADERRSKCVSSLNRRENPPLQRLMAIASQTHGTRS